MNQSSVPKILHVDDDKEFRAVLGMYLNFEFKDHLTFLEASNAFEAIEMIKSNDIKLIVSDIDMPNGCGRKLHSMVHHGGYGIPMIYISGSIEGEMASQLPGIKAYFPKADLPRAFKDIETIIQDVLREVP